MKGGGYTESWLYLGTRAIADIKPDHMHQVFKLMRELTVQERTLLGLCECLFLAWVSNDP